MTITLLYAGLLALIFFALSYRVVQARSSGISLGDGGDLLLLRRIRAHGNFAEYVPLLLLMIALLEFEGLPDYAIHGLGLALVLARSLHGYALAFTESFQFGRFWGTALTFLLLVVCALLCIWRSVLAQG